MINCVAVFASGERLPAKLTGYANSRFDIRIDPPTALPPTEIVRLHFPDQQHVVMAYVTQVPGLPLRLMDQGPAP